LSHHLTSRTTCPGRSRRRRFRRCARKLGLDVAEHSNPLRQREAIIFDDVIESAEKSRGSFIGEMECHRLSSAPAVPTLPPVLGLRVPNGLPLHAGDGIRSAARERDDVISHIAGTGAGRQAGRWARVLARPPFSILVFLARSPGRRRKCVHQIQMSPFLPFRNVTVVGGRAAGGREAPA
jgi:hypothetical protein